MDILDFGSKRKNFHATDARHLQFQVCGGWGMDGGLKSHVCGGYVRKFE
jgi:hypothetical protein